MKAIPHPFFLQFKITNALCVIEFKNLKMSRKTQAYNEFILAMEYREQQGKQENFEP